MTEFDRFKYEISNCETPTLFHPLLPRLFCSVSWEFSASGCLSVSEFPIAAHEAEQDRKQAGGGSFFFGYFLLAKQKKVTRVSRESDRLPIRINPKYKITRFRPSSESRSVKNTTPHHTLNDAPPA